MIPKILIVGLGQLGSRYLQGALIGDPNLSIDILEPNIDSYEKGMSVVESGSAGNTFDVKRINLDEMSAHYNICVVATSAGPRADIIQSVCANTRIDNWVIEKVVAQSEAQLQDVREAVRRSVGAWVNTPRRRTSVYRALKSKLKPASPIRYEANFPMLGLGCNAIHFIDLVSWLVESAVKTAHIEAPQGWKPSKRDGYQEFEGKLTVNYEDGSVLALNSDTEDPVAISVHQDGKHFQISESEGVREGANFYPGRVEYQSELSHELISDILQNKVQDGLPTLEQSIDQHLALFDAIRNCTSLQLNNDSELPIT